MTKLSLFPQTALIEGNHLFIGGCDVVELAALYGTPVYIFDEVTLRAKCAEFHYEFTSRYPNALIIYACKAFVNPALALLFKEAGLGMDVTSGGELSIARCVAFPPDLIYFHGNNKTAAEIELALEFGVGRIVADNFSELRLLSKLTQAKGTSQDILLRLSPGIDPHTHQYMTTGIIDSKFGFPIYSGQAEEALVYALSTPSLNLVGLHFHLGSSILATEPYQQAIEIVLHFSAEMKAKYGFELKEFSPGGGFAIQCALDSPARPLAEYAEVITKALQHHCENRHLSPPRLIIEPGRAIIGQAGVALYRVGAMKEVPQVRKYIFIDGGMADNIRPALYGSRYEVLVANKAQDHDEEVVTIAGKFCESADILIKDINLPKIASGDLIAIPCCGAYSLAMASNYNASLKPAIILAKGGEARLIRKREDYSDLVSHDIW